MRPGEWLSQLLEFTYPSTCACGGTAPARRRLCDACADELQALEGRPCCDRCALPLATSGAPCPRCRRRGIKPLGRVACLGVFDDPLKHLIHRFKYNHDWTTGEYLADRLAAHPSAAAVVADCDCLVPIPLHPIREIARGYNQADVLAARVGNRRGLDVCHALIRTRNTPHQTDMTSRADRLKNVRSAFAVPSPELVKGKRVAIVDDVMTIGATLREASRALAAAGPASINAIVLAVADPKGRAFEMI